MSDQKLDHGMDAAAQILAAFGAPAPPDKFAAFHALGMAAGWLTTSDDVAQVHLHVDYLAGKAGREPAHILDGGSFEAEDDVISDALTNISAVLRSAIGKAPPAPAGVPAEVFSLILTAEATLQGWCSREKSLFIATTALAERPELCVEIGIFGGRSLFPCAAALRHNGAGVIYGIETWSPAAAVSNQTNAANDDWWSKVNFHGIKRAFYRFVAEHDIADQVRVIEAPSARAAALFDRIDFLHIDGSHSTVGAVEDVILYIQKVRRGGIILMDDISWASTQPAVEVARALCDMVMSFDPIDGTDNCAVLRRR